MEQEYVTLRGLIDKDIEKFTADNPYRKTMHVRLANESRQHIPRLVDDYTKYAVAFGIASVRSNSWRTGISIQFK